MANITISEEELFDEPTLEINAGQAHRITVEKAIGKIHAQLFDESGAHRLADTAYSGTINDGEEISGTTDQNGVLSHGDAWVGEYAFTIGEEVSTTIPTVRTSQSEPHRQVVVGWHHEESEDDDLEPDPDDDEDVLDTLADGLLLEIF